MLIFNWIASGQLRKVGNEICMKSELISCRLPASGCCCLCCCCCLCLVSLVKTRQLACSSNLTKYMSVACLSFSCLFSCCNCCKFCGCNCCCDCCCCWCCWLRAEKSQLSLAAPCCLPPLPKQMSTIKPQTLRVDSWNKVELATSPSRLRVEHSNNDFSYNSVCRCHFTTSFYLHSISVLSLSLSLSHCLTVSFPPAQSWLEKCFWFVAGQRVSSIHFYFNSTQCQLHSQTERVVHRRLLDTLTEL